MLSYNLYPQVDCLDSLQIRTKKNITYNTLEGKSLQLDLFYPKKSNKMQNLIILIPDVKMSSRMDYNCMAVMLANEGFAVCTLEYRGPPDYSYPKAQNDILNATEWIKSNESKLNLKINSIGLVGQSFGGYLAALLGAKYPGKFLAVASIHAPMNLISYEIPDFYPYVYHSYLRYPKLQRPDIWKEASPINNILKSSGNTFLFFHGKNDNRVSVKQTNEMYDALESSRIHAFVKILDNAPNGYFNKNEGLSFAVKEISSRFKKVFVPIPNDVEIIRNVHYAKANGRFLRMNIFRPEHISKSLPAVLFLHGGGGMWGRKEDMEREAAELASKGFITACVEYRLVRENLFPAAMDDIKAAVRWIRKNADEYRIDGNNIGIVGSSMGAYIGAMLGVTNDKEYFDESLGPANQSSKINAVVTISGVVDMVGLHPRDPYTTTTIFRASPVENPDLYKKYSPINLVSNSAAKFLFIHGTDDELGSHNEMVEMAKRLSEVGVFSKVISIDQGQHNFWRHESNREKGMREMIEFLNYSLKAKN